MSTYETKDSGERASFASGMVRDSEKGKARFDLLLPLGIPYEEQMLTRDAQLMARGAEKYEERNWEKATGEAELARYRSSALRHLMQWVAGEEDEDHAAAVRFNIMAGEFVKSRMAQAPSPGEFVRAYSQMRGALADVPPAFDILPSQFKSDPLLHSAPSLTLMEEGNVDHDLLAEVSSRGQWPVDVRVNGVLICCGMREHSLDCPKWR